MVQILLVLEVLLIQDSEEEDLFCDVPSGFDLSLFFSNYRYLFGLGLKFNHDDFQHNFARRASEADTSVVLTELLTKSTVNKLCV